ncbi:MAG: Polyribonucleotide nucleotidyltransferase [Candidatus Shapirobacteria bacterium GW2011_GWE1_38_10]|uniref:Polyribonucleotide nucleotidyltransferase n=1 Tax=Candidatus Shapirobacteria bacterium GW2011_GWE1_38_10 TaxID=1618488 RepID=A0A0G0I5W2_9BACT|nr:MAG: Polyribonucleotide nucleotidyltransferase [Candidatus Shapirobacteria bacterium GW2011_GWF2_37_20]KKQ49957.1 MAG: Polyribonucleotide nucleotidyltransferase [Candidatus Shapirobacteria bacterium GW2011_GWE1_38_10]KKQ62752.1 MAG: Polyribonucleotide nucleotidyltransferase [Candidatus Shapirobacteria bacterium GW2011_GWF1_38_23]
MAKNSVDITIGNKKITLTTGQLAPQANAAVTAQIGNTVVLATVVLGAIDKNKDYFPLSVEFADKLYAGGLIKGGKWIKREGGPSDTAILFGRIIDRSIRPLFSTDFKYEVQVIVTVLSNDKENDVVIPAFTAVSTALMLSDIPFSGPVSIVRVGSENNELKLFPTISDLQKSTLDLLVCKDAKGINMIEADANIVDNDTALKAMQLAFDTGTEINKQLEEFAKKFGKKKIEYEPLSPSKELISEIETLVKKELTQFMADGVDGAHIIAEDKIKEKVKEAYETKIKAEEVEANQVIEAVDILVRQYLRTATLAGTRYDKRAFDEIRPLEIEAGVLPMTHGSALFQRGLTQALTITTLGSLAEQQYLQSSNGEVSKRYIHYYSAAPFSTGQTGRFGRPGRREVGHGALAEKALVPVIPSIEDFPYTITLTSEVMSQNGSSSMASTCGSTLSLMDAGVPIKDKVAGISIGMISDDADKYVLLTDIAGIEDHCGDMDFKITGTRNGITAIQLDIKRMGLSMQMIIDTFAASTKARLQILDKIDSVLPAPRAELSQYAPKIKMITLPEDKIGEVIGSGGKTIKGLMEKYGVEIDIDDDGRASVCAIDKDKIDACLYEIESMIKEVQIGEEYDGVVTRVEAYGAFVEFLPGREALLHVSELSGGFISDPSSIIKIGDKLKVKISGFNDNHQIKLSSPEFKAAHPGNPDAMPQRDGPSASGRPPFRNFGSPSGQNRSSFGGGRPRR